MANFGWAYVGCTDTTSASGSGPTGSLQFISGGLGHTTGSAHLIFYTSSVAGNPPHSLVLSGNLVITGTLSASVINYENIAVIDATGSTKFGNTNDDWHQRTGSFVLVNSAYPNNPHFSSSAETRQTYIRAPRFRYRGTTSTSITLAVNDMIIGVRGTNAVEITLPSASVTDYGAVYLIKDEVTSRVGASNNITLTGSPGSDVLIDGSGEYILTGSMPAISLYSNGTSWFVF